MWSDGKLADMIIMSEQGSEIRCHRCVMVNASAVFEQMLSSSWKEGVDSCITIRNESCATIHVFIAYLYTDLLPKHADLGALLRLADMYEISGLSKACFSAMATDINAATAGTTLKVLVSHKRCQGSDDAFESIAKRAKADTDIAYSIARDYVFEEINQNPGMQKKVIQIMLKDKEATCKAMRPVLDGNFLRND
eukprot:gnl/MRDRNA2_/MRDRNA2_211308_c0_seq1.p1 gnl/MRDRNA2_/MRDRNA2_211308_c0~~gnl/MRDRNA2_/MRDRNA2_211308_c0_seq1.p1  ORF type:complete len:194 (+),score=34.85 gnl/MRDRNA2_/MRDRNA2_211308_c0_seq1:3-584(+)